LSGVDVLADDLRTTTSSRPQRRYDHGLRDLAQRIGDLTVATNLGVSRSRAPGWFAAAPALWSVWTSRHWRCAATI